LLIANLVIVSHANSAPCLHSHNIQNLTKLRNKDSDFLDFSMVSILHPQLSGNLKPIVNSMSGARTPNADPSSSPRTLHWRHQKLNHFQSQLQVYSLLWFSQIQQIWMRIQFKYPNPFTSLTV